MHGKIHNSHEGVLDHVTCNYNTYSNSEFHVHHLDHTIPVERKKALSINNQ